jgi:cytidylate kinase
MIKSRGMGDLLEPPLHGNQGDREPPPILEAPLGLTVAISREAGARGGSIAKRLSKQLGWQVYTQDLLEFMCGNENARAQLLNDMTRESVAWADQQLQRLRDENVVNPKVELGEMPRLILTLAARGGVILVGRGAGHLLPRDSTLHVRIVAPLEDRVHYMAQWLRLTPEDAALQVRERDEKRTEFLLKYFNRRSADLYDYDIILNSFLLGEDVCTDLIANAVRAKEELLNPDEDD